MTPIFFDFRLCDSVTLSQALKLKAYHIFDTLKKDCPRLPSVKFVAVEKRDRESNTLAYATLGKKVIYIDTSITYSNCLYHVVLHELVHAICGLEHKSSNFLMAGNLPAVLDDLRARDCFIDIVCNGYIQ